MLATPNGVIHYTYDSWGNLIEQAGNTPNLFTWNGAYGYEFIPFTGLYHVGAREYDPRTARWLQRDPIDVAGGHPNVYVYCGNDPVNYSDSDGISEDPGGPKGSVRYSVTAFIPVQTVVGPGGVCFKGDNRRFSPDSPRYRVQIAFVAYKNKEGKLNVDFKNAQVGTTEVVDKQGRVIWKGKANATVGPNLIDQKPVVMPRNDGGVDVILSFTASNPYYPMSPPISFRATFRLDKEGRIISFSGFHSAYPAFEIWQYTGAKYSRGNSEACATMLYGFDPTIKNPSATPWDLLGRVYFRR